jgi:AraC-like DNA-binding protein
MRDEFFDWISLDPLFEAVFRGVEVSRRVSADGQRHSDWLEVPSQLGTGSMELVRLAEDISVLIYDVNWLRETVFEVRDGPYMRFNFTLEQNMTMAIDEGGDVGVVQPSWRFLNNARERVVRETITSGTRNAWVTMVFKDSFVCRQLGLASLADDAAIAGLFRRPEGDAVYREYPLDYRLNQMVSNLIASNLDDRLHLPYVQGKALELFCVALDHMLHERKEEAIPVLLRPRDEKAVMLARELIDKNLADPPGLRELCTIVGINRNKLQYGFRHLFDASISKYIQDARLTEAYRLLEQGDSQIIAVAQQVGFTHQSSFSTAFKKKFGFSPSQVRTRS